MARRRNRRGNKTQPPKKAGQYGETIIKKFPSAIEALRHRYKPDFPDMCAYFCFNGMGKSFIFQKLSSLPVVQIDFNDDAKTIILESEWESEGACKYHTPKKFFEVEAKDSSQYVSWHDVNDIVFPNFRNKKKSLRDLWDDTLECFSSFKIEDVRSINMYGWGFEIIGDVISMLAVKQDCFFPYQKKGEELSKDITISFDNENCTFKFSENLESDELIVRWSEAGFEPVREKKGVDEFDVFLFGEKLKQQISSQEKKKRMNVGQRDMSHILIDE